MNKMLFVDRCESRSHLHHYFESQFDLQPAATTDESRQRFSIHELHRVKVVPAAFSPMKPRSHICMVDAGCSSSFPNETATGRFVADEFCANDLQSHWASEMGINGLIGYSH